MKGIKEYSLNHMKEASYISRNVPQLRGTGVPGITLKTLHGASQASALTLPRCAGIQGFNPTPHMKTTPLDPTSPFKLLRRLAWLSCILFSRRWAQAPRRKAEGTACPAKKGLGFPITESTVAPRGLPACARSPASQLLRPGGSSAHAPETNRALFPQTLVAKTLNPKP